MERKLVPLRRNARRLQKAFTGYSVSFPVLTRAISVLLTCIFALFILTTLLTSRASLSPQVMGSEREPSEKFAIVLFLCVWKRPLLTEFVLSYYSGIRGSLLVEHGIHLHIFVTGSDNTTTAHLATRYGAGHADHPNSPLGAKHNLGLRSLRDHFIQRARTSAISSNARLPDAVAIAGSDDLLNTAFFVHARVLMTRLVGRRHVVGLRDLYFFDLFTQRLVYTRGYREFRTPISGTLGCGRVFSWAMLETIEWDMWDSERERGLDQSAIRNVMKRVPLVGEISEAVAGREHGIVAVDVKTDAFEAGANIWKFDEVVAAVGKNGRLHMFEEQQAQTVLDTAFGTGFLDQSIAALRQAMMQHQQEQSP